MEQLMFKNSRIFPTTINIFISLSLLLGSAIIVTPVHAAGIVVNTNTDPSGITGLVDGKCSLREAVANANNDNQGYTDCAAGSGADTITFAANYTISLPLGELLITSIITIQGNGSANTIIQANGSAGTAT